MKKTTRRDFIKYTTTGLGYLVAAGNFPRPARASALQGVAVACIGVGGGKGGSDHGSASVHGNVVALCDVDRIALEGAARTRKITPDNLFADFRDLFAERGDRFDACTITTPDHTHTVIAAMALKAKKHCFTQKPLTRTIAEARYLGQLAREAGVCTQMGNQGCSFDSLRRIAAEVHAGVIGDIKEVYVWTNRPIWPQGPNRDLTMEKFSRQIREEDPDLAEDEIAEKKQQIAKTLETLNWDLWLGPAPHREYWPGLYHPFAWRGWWDFGTGSLGDMACHTFNLPFAACDLKNPVRVTAESSGHDFIGLPATTKIRFEFPANDWRGAIPVTWSDSKMRPSAEIFDRYGFYNPDSGAIIIGEKGAVYSGGDYGSGYDIKAEGGEVIPDLDVDFRVAPTNEQSDDFDKRHQLEWFTAIRENRPDLCWSNFPDYGGPLTETILLGNLAVWAAPEAGKQGEIIEWDAQNLAITNLPELKTPGLAELVHPKYQNGYEQF